jgi:DhnA family fructose-bisphosphate aldolase class Ia
MLQVLNFFQEEWLVKFKKMVMIVAFECVTLFAHQYPMLVVLNIYARTHNFETEKKIQLLYQLVF